MKRMRPSTLALGITIALTSSATLAADQEALKELQERIEILEMEVIDARDAAKHTDRVKFSKGEASPELVSRDGRASLEFKARIQADAVHAGELYTGKKLNDYNEAFNTTSIRRLRFGIEGQFARDWEYEIEIDFADNEVDIKDANIGYEGWENSKLTIGYQKYAFGLESTGSSANLLFMERAPTDAFAPERALGVQYRYIGNQWMLQTGLGWDAKTVEEVELVIEDGELDENESIYHDEVLTYNARLTATPINNNLHFLSVGASYLYTGLDRDQDQYLEMRYRARPGTKATGRMVDTGKFAAKSSQSYGAEFIYQYQNLMVQSEYIASSADAVETDNVDVDAWYLSGSWVITGESWSYKKGKLRSPKPKHAVSQGGWGAWEVALRYDQANFATDVLKYGGDMTNYVLGLNWYLERNLKAQLNYVYAEADYPKSYEAIDGTEFTSQDTNIVQARIQFAF
ncbi:OprO/OprP family phosphate-selective porin [Ferrimonas balearica]|uniref:OprO/OprP family phosphate-selective porin n=1 Tax=Ferrimonas balearica TaxID=44012 RepID=UPI001C997B57|nr:porin [Ferrimonas balearica]MBY5921530.1 OprO/OprP family phosphate-selective porin [Ferrimonas balearica]MBY5995785.1 OprO/OprP family phosphate-selective porin [Ferrimonas balearica]